MKLGLSNFLNAKPLVQNLPAFFSDIFWGSPSQCADLLASAQVDIALLPSIEFARMKDAAIIPGFGISSLGPVHSVLLFSKGDMSTVRTIAVDERSRTAVALLEILCKEYFHIRAEMTPMKPDLAAMLNECDASLVIGDQALKAFHEYQGPCFDLGALWNQLTQSPFTYAFFAGRMGTVDEDELRLFSESCAKGVGEITAIAGREADEYFTQNFLLGYWTKFIQYELTELHETGLKIFYEKAYQYRLINHIPELRFYGVEAHRF